MSRTTQAVVDLAVLSLALWIAFFLRFDGVPPFLMFKRLVFLWPWVVCLQFGILVLFGIHRFSWRFIGLREVTRILASLAVSTTILLILRLLTGRLTTTVSGYFDYALIPLSVIAMNFTIAFLGITGIRGLRRLNMEKVVNRERARASSNESEPTLLIGAGEAGMLVARELQANPELGMRSVGFLDDDIAKIGSVVHGVRVLATTAKMREMVEKHQVTQVLITIASARGKDIRRIGRECRELGLKTKIIPPVRDIVGGQVNLHGIRELAIEDLLRREPVSLDQDTISQFIEGQVVVVSGAGGSIGSELCAQICRYQPKRLLLIERAENALFEVHRALCAQFPDADIRPCIADIGDTSRLRTLFRSHSPTTVFHAAAHKHVPMMEENPGEALKNNVLGTKSLADISNETGVDAFVMVSTDKAVNPTSVMGATKRIAEMYVQSLAERSSTRFVTVRFGNVLGSAGSVIPIFKKQIAEGGPLTVTHPDMTRYFMTIPEACQLILQAGTMGEGGEIFILDMGEPVRIVDLAKDLIGLSGLEAGEDILIEFTGIRPGEKLYEELSTRAENTSHTRHPKIMVGKNTGPRNIDICVEIENLRSVIESSPDEVRRAIPRVVPEYHSPKRSTPVLPTQESSTENPAEQKASSGAEAVLA